MVIAVKKEEQKPKPKQKMKMAGTRISPECVDRLEILKREIKAKSDTELLRIIIEHAVGLRSVDGLRGVRESIEAEVTQRDDATIDATSVPSEDLIPLLKDVHAELRQNRKEMKNLGEFYLKRFSDLSDKITEARSSIEEELSLHSQELKSIKKHAVGIASIVEIIASYLTKFNSDFFAGIRQASVEIIDEFVSRFYDTQRTTKTKKATKPTKPVMHARRNYFEE